MRRLYYFARRKVQIVQKRFWPRFVGAGNARGDVNYTLPTGSHAICHISACNRRTGRSRGIQPLLAKGRHVPPRRHFNAHGLDRRAMHSVETCEKCDKLRETPNGESSSRPISSSRLCCIRNFARFILSLLAWPQRLSGRNCLHVRVGFACSTRWQDRERRSLRQSFADTTQLVMTVTLLLCYFHAHGCEPCVPMLSERRRKTF